MMKNLLFTFTLLFVLYQHSIGQKAKMAPLNTEFKEFIENKSEATGYIPEPTTYVFTEDLKTNLKTDFPSSFDLRDELYVTSVKDQAGAGHCWAFAAIGAVESRNLVLDLGTYDLSEHNLATCNGFLAREGGNRSKSTAYFSRLDGPILESEDPYSDTDFGCLEDDIEPTFYVPESRYLPANPAVIKDILMNHGAIQVSYYADDAYLNSGNNSYYYSGNEDPNHAVLLIGWNDEKVTSGGTGAWLIKNSWGTGWGENGYFYMSYNDTYAISFAAIYPIRKEINNIDTILMYDELGEISAYGYGDNEDYGLVKYTVSETHNFNKVGTYIGAMSSVIDIEIFDTLTEDTVLTDTLAKSYNNFCEYPGYHTFDIPFTANGDFYIKIKYNTPNDDYPIPVERILSSYAIPSIEENVGWISDDGITWNLVGRGTDAEVDMCIRAYGSKSGIQASYTANEQNICSDGSVTFTNTSIGSITKYSWDFGEGATPAVATTEGPHSINYSSNGFKTVKLVVEDSEGIKDSIINYNYIYVGGINVNITPADSGFVNIGDTIDLTAYGADTYSWTPTSSILGDASNQTVKVLLNSTSYVYVTGTKNSCTSTDSVKIIVTEAPENDDVCDAISLTLNAEHGPYTNAGATVETNEPMPPVSETGCNTPGYWCSEGGLQNSIWFKFEAPNSGIVSIETDGFDNQIAVYDAENCLDIVSGDTSLYEIIAANDDWEDADYSATIEEITGMTTGKTYWLQMDGSAGGDEGECTITISEAWPASLNNKLSEQDVIKVYPNPSNGDFKLDLSKVQKINNNSTIEILALDGSMIKKIECYQDQYEYDLSVKHTGMFIIRVNTISNSYTVPILIK